MKSSSTSRCTQRVTRIFQTNPTPHSATGRSPGPPGSAAKARRCSRSISGCIRSPTRRVPRSTFLGRYTELASRYPLSYYTTLAANKTTLPKTVAPKTKRATPIDFRPSLTMKVRLDRARVLEEAQLPEWAELELQWSAENESNPFPAALALAETASRRGAHDVSIRYIKRFATGYLSIPIEAAPEKFWKLAFPLPYSRADRSKSRGLDPYIVAALMRQESEFNPKAISRAKAYGLTQVLPSTGRGTQAGGWGVPALYSIRRCFEPTVNLTPRDLLPEALVGQHNGKWEETLALVQRR